jgi:hypothetical protein
LGGAEGRDGETKHHAMSPHRANILIEVPFPFPEKIVHLAAAGYNHYRTHFASYLSSPSRINHFVSVSAP